MTKCRHAAIAAFHSIDLTIFARHSTPHPTAIWCSFIPAGSWLVISNRSYRHSTFTGSSDITAVPLNVREYGTYIWSSKVTTVLCSTPSSQSFLSSSLLQWSRFLHESRFSFTNCILFREAETGQHIHKLWQHIYRCEIWQGFHQKWIWEGTFFLKPPSNDSRGIIPLNLSLFGNFFLVLKM
jgi:hypothetical protein